MHCKGCDVELTDFEATRKIEGTDKYLDLCGLCIVPIIELVAISSNYLLYDKTDSERETTSYPEGVEADGLSDCGIETYDDAEFADVE